MDWVGCRVRVRFLRRNAKQKKRRVDQSEEEKQGNKKRAGSSENDKDVDEPARTTSSGDAGGGRRELEWKEVVLSGTVEAFRPKSGKHLVVMDMVYGRCVNGGLFGAPPSARGGSSSAQGKEAFVASALDRKGILIVPCKYIRDASEDNAEGIVCLPWARSIYFDLCTCHQQRVLCGPRSGASGEAVCDEDPSDEVSRTMSWAMWLSLGDLESVGLLARCSQPSMVCICRKPLLEEKNVGYAGDAYRACSSCGEQYHTDCIQFDAAKTEELVCPFCMACVLAKDNIEQGLASKRAKTEPAENGASTDECDAGKDKQGPSKRKRTFDSAAATAHRRKALPRIIRREGLRSWRYWSSQQLSSSAAMAEGAPDGEWIFTLNTLRHLCGARPEAFVELELDAIAGRSDEHRNDVVKENALPVDTKRELARRLALIGCDAFPGFSASGDSVESGEALCAVGTVPRFLAETGSTKEFALPSLDSLSKLEEGSMEAFFRQTFERDASTAAAGGTGNTNDELASAEGPMYGRQLPKPNGMAAIYSPRGGLIEKRLGISQVEFSAWAFDKRDDGTCMSAKGTRYIRKWPGAKGVTGATCARVRPRDGGLISASDIDAARKQSKDQLMKSGPERSPSLKDEFLANKLGLIMYATGAAARRMDAMTRRRGMSRSPRKGRAPHSAVSRKALREHAAAVSTDAKDLALGREKRLRFGKSPIHAWGVFAEEPLAPNDFVIEYKGELIRPVMSDLREQQYAAQGIPDYMFRIDNDVICDATLKGSLARFINHSCEPNCFSDIITKNSTKTKHIVIYAKKPVRVGEELSYDYKFPIETDPAEKIPCSCGAALCRGFMN